MSVVTHLRMAYCVYSCIHCAAVCNWLCHSVTFCQDRMS